MLPLYLSAAAQSPSHSRYPTCVLFNLKANSKTRHLEWGDSSELTPRKFSKDAQMALKAMFGKESRIVKCVAAGEERGRTEKRQMP